MGRHHPGLALEPIELQPLRKPEPGIRKAQKEHILRGGVGHLHQCSQAFHETQELKSSNLVLLDLAIRRSRGTLEFTYMWWKKIQAVFCYEMSGRWGRGGSQVYKTHPRIWPGNGATERVSLQPDLWKVKPPIKVLVKSLSPPSFSLQSPWLHLPLLNSSRALSYTLLIMIQFAVLSASYVPSSIKLLNGGDSAFLALFWTLHSALFTVGIAVVTEGSDLRGERCGPARAAG